ncbi:MAG: hypothetical protein IMZ71_00215 [Chloroflexi bacterium]|nr:hypothetical protein [Chloroflexota bacterium]
MKRFILKWLGIAETVPVVILAPTIEPTIWRFYGKARMEIEHAKHVATVWPDLKKPAEYVDDIKRLIAEREKYLAQHEQAAEALKADLAILREALPQESKL